MIMQRDSLKRMVIVPEDLYRNGSATRSVARALAAVALSGGKENPLKIVQRNFPNDEAAELIVKAAVSPTSTSASSITPTIVGPFLRALAPASAAARLFARALQLDFAGVYQYTIPYPSAVPVPIFIGEGAPFPMVQATIAKTTVGPTHKILLGSAVTGELESYSAESAAAIIGNILTDQMSRSLDTYVFDNVAGDAVRPAGLLNGVTPIAPDPTGGLAKDIAAIAKAIVTAGGNLDTIVFVCGSYAATALRLTAGPQFNYAIFGTGQVADKMIIGIDAAAIASGYSGVPTVDTTKVATAHFEDTTPLPIATGAQGSGVLATPTRSAWQTDTLFLRVRLNAAWAALRAGAVQTITSVNW
jgi:hypothetical protein